MKIYILFIAFIFANSPLFSQWTRITEDSYILVTKPYAINGDSVYVFRDKVGWFSSFDNGETWDLDRQFLRNESQTYSDDYVGPGVQMISPIFRDEYVYYYNSNSELLISSDYGKSFKKADVKSKSLSSLNKLEFKDDLIFATSDLFGVFISYDKGYTWHQKNKPGRWQLSHLGSKINYENPEDVPDGNSLDNATGIVVLDSSILISSTNSYEGRVYKTQKYEINDSLNTIYFPVSQEYFLKKYGLNEFNSNLSSFEIIEINNIIFVVMTDHIFQGKGYSKIWASYDEGITWEEKDYSSFGLNTIKHLRKCGDVFYATEDGKGIFMSLDFGVTWELFNIGFSEEPDEQNSQLRFGNLQFNDNYAFITNGFNLYRAPLKDCKIVEDLSSVEINERLEVTIYPNPANETVAISGINNGNVEIFNSIGQLLINSKIQGTSNINTSTLHPGIYLLKIEHGNEVTFEKLIINK